MHRRLAPAALVAAAGLLLLSAAGASSAYAAPAPQAEESQHDPALFQVGTAVVDISPDKPMVDGGYSSNYLVTGGAHDPLQAVSYTHLTLPTILLV